MNYLKDKASAIVFTIIIQTLAIVWWASAINAQTTTNASDISVLKNQITTNVSVTLTRDQLNDILASRDAQIQSLNNNLEDFKTETRNSLSRIEQKLK